MDDLSGKRLEAERDGVVSLLRTIADRLATLAAVDAHEPLCRLREPVDTLAQAAAPMLGPLPARPPGNTTPDLAAWPTVVFVRRGSDLEA